MLLTIGELATTLGASVVTLRRWDKAGTLKPYLRTPGGHRRYLLAEVLRGLGVAQTGPEAGRPQKLVVGYARVSSHDQKDDLARQTQRLATRLEGEPHSLLIADMGSGLNFKKRGLSKLLGLILAGRVGRLVLTHKDPLVRFGYELLEQLVLANGGHIEILDDVCGSEDVELAKDVLAIITVFSAKLYGRRSHQNRQKGSLKCIQQAANKPKSTLPRAPNGRERIARSWLMSLSKRPSSRHPSSRFVNSNKDSARRVLPTTGR